jgi:hypothetical protein
MTVRGPKFEVFETSNPELPVTPFSLVPPVTLVPLEMPYRLC